MKRKIMVVHAVSIYLLISSFASFGEENKKKNMADTLRVGDTVGYFEMKSPSGEILQRDALIGKVVLLDFWATWCAPCRKLTHELDSLVKNYHTKSNFQMIGINYREVNKDAAITYWNGHGYLFPMAADNDVFGKSIGAGNPTIIVIDKNGVIRGRWDKYTLETAKEVKSTVDKWL